MSEENYALQLANLDRNSPYSDPYSDQAVMSRQLLLAHETIAALRAENERLREALRRITECAESYYRQITPNWTGDCFEDSDFGMARAALSGEIRAETQEKP